MRTLQRYILIELLRVFVFVLSVMTVLLVFLGVFREASANGLGLLEIVQILPYIIPSLLPFTIPATMLLSVCVVYGRMAGDQEITAAKAAGINVLSLLWPSFFLGGLLSVCALLLTDQVTPWSEANIRRIVTAAMENILLEVLRSQHQTTGLSGGTISVHDIRGKTLIRPTFRYFINGTQQVTARAQEARLQFDLENQQVLLQLKRAQIDVPGQGRQWLEEFEQPFPLSFGKFAPKPRHLSVQEIELKLTKLDKEITFLRNRLAIRNALLLANGHFQELSDGMVELTAAQMAELHNSYFRLRAEVHQRFALACSCFCFVLVGSPFAVLQARRQFLTNFILCFLPIVLVYYPLILLANNLSRTGTVNPVWAMWVGNGIMILAGLFVLRRVARH